MNQTELLIRGLISSLKPERQAEVTRVAQAIRDLIATAPNGEGLLAFGLVGAELEDAK